MPTGWTAALMSGAPPNWIGWVADTGTIVGTLATIILAFQAGSAKKKYQRLINLSRYGDKLNTSLSELDRLIANYTSSSVGIFLWIGPTSDHLKAVMGECSGDSRHLVSGVLSSVTALKNRSTQDDLIKILSGLAEVSTLLTRMAEKAKIDA